MASLPRVLAGTVGRAVSLPRLRERVAGRTVVVTGASRVVGAEVARVLGLAGADVVLVARGSDGLERTAARVRAAGGTATVVPLDLRDADATDAVARELAEASPAVLVSDAGHSIRRSLADSVDRAHDLRRLAGVAPEVAEHLAARAWRVSSAGSPDRPRRGSGRATGT